MSGNAGQVVRWAEVAEMRVSERLHGGGGALARHAHDSLQLCVVLEGEFVEVFDAACFECVPSTLIVRPPLAVHHDVFRAASVRTLLIELRGGSARFAPLFEVARAPLVLPADAREVVRELRASDLAARIALEGVVLRLAAQAMRSWAAPGAATRIAEAKRRLEEVLPRRIDTGTLAAELDVSRSHLFDTFRRVEGCTIGEYVTRRRVEQACELLAGSNAPLSAIADACGFADQPHFTRVFRRETGETPMQFRSRTRTRS